MKFLGMVILRRLYLLCLIDWMTQFNRFAASKASLANAQISLEFYQVHCLYNPLFFCVCWHKESKFTAVLDVRIQCTAWTRE